MAGLEKRAGALQDRTLNFGSRNWNQIPKEPGLDRSFPICQRRRVTKFNVFQNQQEEVILDFWGLNVPGGL